MSGDPCILFPSYLFTESIVKRFLHFFLTALIFLAAVPPQAAAQTAIDINSLRIGTHPDKTRMVIEISQTSHFRAFYLPSPPRIVLDLPNFAWKAGTQTFPANSLVKAVRQGPLHAGISRIVVETDQAVHLRDAFFMPTDGRIPNRIVVDFVKAERNQSPDQQKSFGSLTDQNATLPPAANKTASASREANQDHILRLPPGKEPPKTITTSTVTTRTEPAPPSPIPVAMSMKVPEIPNFKGKKPLIVIDPGHGGQDPGALGHAGHKEKDITLAAAKDLKKHLEETGRYNVQLTRSTDVFIKLQDRVKIARRVGADLFISLHADSIDKPNVHGASIYTLSNKASDAQTAKLAARENRADLIAGVDLSHEDKEVADILIDLAMRDTMNQSKFFANKVVKHADAHGIDLLEGPHRYAGFAVLKAPDTPSVLIEMGFMSNKNEVMRLSSPEYRTKIVSAIGKGIDSYFVKVIKNASN